MLLSAKFENIYSFNEETRILFTASKSDLLPLHVSRAEKRDDISVLRMGLIYGANASGKSNIIKCLAIIKEFALNGWSNRKFNYFKMTDDPQERSSIELEFKVNNQFFAYGIAFSKGGLLEEWLYKTGSRTDAMIFERKRNDDNWENTIASQYLKTETGSFLKFLIDGTPTKGTFLSEYIKRNGKGIDAIKSTRKWFENLNIIFPNTHRTDFPFRAVNDNQFKNVMRELLGYFGTGISDLLRVESKSEELGIPDEIRQKIEESLDGKDEKTGIVIHNENRFIFAEKDVSKNLKWYELKTIHRKEDSSSDYIFEMFEESDGTSRLFDFIPMLIDMRSNDAVYIIDEVDRSLHPILTLKLLELYNSLLRNDSQMQLICTTHESNLLSTAPIRQDEVWFVEKDKLGASHLSSLCEYKPRENIQKGYLNGRYGAIPFFGELNNIHWDYAKQE
ncbi:MAG: ATP-binding protein [Paludibacteraceae bacterium]|nr:ATP-binding protein [Paludibacteraceae bacterium]